MVRRIVIELDNEEDLNGLANEIVLMVMSRIDSSMEFSVRQEFVPDRKQKQISIPEFLRK